ncbi:coiled-coil domain-containing protein 146 [Echeneis naucrates]|uniref:coiled-coil domain-containing protein 146 n=1 Tax=Echeneis naucrates TaxID=173247 RepID=UPI00111369D8|nr:coiled-coil domain-containing protein 146 [Echeneis naucrates]
MSLSEQQDSRPTSRGEVEMEEQEEMERNRTDEAAPLLPLAPDALLLEDQPPAIADVSVSPFQCLDELFSLGKISQTKVAKLKASYSLLQETLKRSQDSEIQHLEEAKRCRAELKRLQAEIHRTEEQCTSEEPESEVTELRQQLLQVYNELKAAEDREYETQHQLKCLLEEKEYLEKENEIQPKSAELESKTKTLRDKHEDLRKEVEQRQLEVRNLMEDVETHETLTVKEQKELEDPKEIIELKEAEKAQLISIHDQTLEKIRRKRTKKEAAEKQIEALNTETSKMEQQVKQVEEYNHSLSMKTKVMMQELEALQAQVAASQVEYREMLKEQEVIKEEEAEFIGNRGILEMKLQHIMCDRKHLYESQSVQLREKNRQIQTLMRMEHALTTANEQLQHMQSVYNDLQAQIDAVPKRETSIQQKLELRKEVDALKVTFEKQLSGAEEENQKNQQCGMIPELLKESNGLREELHNLRCLTQIKAEERGQKHRELLRAQQLSQQIQHELREKDLIIMDHNKLHTMLQRRISQYSKLCDTFMEEKIKYVNLKQIASQTITELTEQVKVLENEMDIQHTILINKERLVTKARKKLSNSSKMRNKLQNDISKVVWKQREISKQSEDNKQELVKLTQMINQEEQALLEINKNHEIAIQRRNFLGIQLLEHEEVLFSHHEKVNIQDVAIAKGNVALEMMEKEIKELQSAINEERRQMELKKKEVPLKKKLEEEITMLQIELSEVRDRTLESLNQTVDYKELKGKDPSTTELLKKIEQLEMNLAQRERQLLEKELLVDQVTRLSKPLRQQAEACQQDQLSLRKKLNDLRTRIVNTNYRLMAISAELAMKQAIALTQQQEIKERELQMDRCQQRLEQDLPPCPEIEEEWRRMLRDKKMRQRDREERERLAKEEEWNQLPNGEYTTAEARPNAYIPQTDSLPLPKPYGAQAPFKPSQPGANMRHIRKPTLKHIAI